MITENKLTEIVRSAVPVSHRSGVTVKLDSASGSKLKDLRVITEAWKKVPRFERAGKVIEALFKSVPLKERGHIISVGVFTKEEWKDRMAFARKLNRITDSGGKPKAVAKKPSMRKSSSYGSKAASKLRIAGRKSAL